MSRKEGKKKVRRKKREWERGIVVWDRHCLWLVGGDWYNRDGETWVWRENGKNKNKIKRKEKRKGSEWRKVEDKRGNMCLGGVKVMENKDKKEGKKWVNGCGGK